MPGQRFGKWTVVAVIPAADNYERRRTCCRVRCDCGNEALAQRYNLVAGHTTQCRSCASKAGVRGIVEWRKQQPRVAQPPARNAAPVDWEVLADRVLELDQAGKSAREIGLALNVSRNSVVGWLDRNRPRPPRESRLIPMDDPDLILPPHFRRLTCGSRAGDDSAT
jgi:hypothetical protein